MCMALKGNTHVTSKDDSLNVMTFFFTEMLVIANINYKLSAYSML